MFGKTVGEAAENLRSNERGSKPAKSQNGNSIFYANDCFAKNRKTAVFWDIITATKKTIA